MHTRSDSCVTLGQLDQDKPPIVPNFYLKLHLLARQEISQEGIWGIADFMFLRVYVCVCVLVLARARVCEFVLQVSQSWSKIRGQLSIFC